MKLPVALVVPCGGQVSPSGGPSVAAHLDASAKRVPERERERERGRERGAKRSTVGWEEFAKMIETRAEERAEESKKPGEGVDISQFHVARETEAGSVGESDVKFDETVFEFAHSAWRESIKEGELH